ncbi:LamB/YcsF family protein [Psychrobacillus soli]|uniref:5-oxoprolinase subunit A n=1 Tax=Psychrobacillus soli TaxID=1543965 RepID=A0A544T8G4_9BACI|nr:5-oxoprolinase subunit PxpA [Psychrobacillus soli]TQR13739.1 LamB/YcsF family protein [Psychrobacillus soli]
MTKIIDLNCDMGESFGAYKLGMDEEVIQLISSANIACGFHAGDPNVMDHTVAMAKEYNVGIGVHIGYPDLLGFGRRDIDISRKDLMNYIIYQIGALEAFCRKHQVQVQHVKAHGSMGNMSFVNRNIADAIVDAVQEVLPTTKLFVLPGTEIHKAAEEKGLSHVLEVFADRAYNRDATLVSRKLPGAVIKDPQEAADNVLRMILDGKAKTIDGEFIDIKADSICVHGDTQGALDIVRHLRRCIEEKGIEIAPVGRWHA